MSLLVGGALVVKSRRDVKGQSALWEIWLTAVHARALERLMGLHCGSSMCDSQTRVCSKSGRLEQNQTHNLQQYKANQNKQKIGRQREISEPGGSSSLPTATGLTLYTKSWECTPWIVRGERLTLPRLNHGRHTAQSTEPRP